MTDWQISLLGGVLIGLAASLLLLFNGRISGVSGILGGVVSPTRGEFGWRIMFIAGLISGGFALKWLHPQTLVSTVSSPYWTLPVAGFLVGFGTTMGNGCTSGHGVCGISRLSPRSLVATVIFMLGGIATVLVMKKLGVSTR